MLRSLVQLVPRLGHEGVVLLLDEAERRLSVEAKPTKASAEAMITCASWSTSAGAMSCRVCSSCTR